MARGEELLAYVWILGSRALFPKWSLGAWKYPTGNTAAYPVSVMTPALTSAIPNVAIMP